jgi:hypothetical protein
MSFQSSMPNDLHDLLNALRAKSKEHSAETSETEQLLIATVLKIADDLADLRVKLRRVAL